MLIKAELEPSFVLHQRPYRETSALVEAFGLNTGRVGMIAKGVRRPRSSLRGLLQPFTPLLLTWSTRRDLGLLTDAELAEYCAPLAGESLLSGLYLNELLMRLLHRHDPHPELYLHYRATLNALREPGVPIEAVLRIFEKRLLHAIGYGLVLDRDAAEGAPIGRETRYRYLPDVGPVPAGPGGQGGIAVTGETLVALDEERFERAETLLEAKRLMRSLLTEQLGDRPLASRVLFRRAPGKSAG